MLSESNHKVNRKYIGFGLVIIFVVSAACSLTSVISRSVSSPGDSVDIVDDELAGGGGDGCFTIGKEFDEYWENTRLKDLSFKGKTCATGNLAAYRNCLKSRVLQEGMCIEEAEMACSQEYADLPVLFGGENARIPLDPTHSEAIESMGSMEVNDWGFVEGVLMYDLKDAHLCTIGVEADFKGELDDGTCSLKGEADLNFLYEGSACASVCNSGPDSDIPCPVTRSGRTTWQATITWDDTARKWIISGGVGCDDDESPGCVGFRGEE
jgi:hypothetical protein